MVPCGDGCEAWAKQPATPPSWQGNTAMSVPAKSTAVSGVSRIVS